MQHLFGGIGKYFTSSKKLPWFNKTISSMCSCTFQASAVVDCWLFAVPGIVSLVLSNICTIRELLVPTKIQKPLGVNL